MKALTQNFLCLAATAAICFPLSAAPKAELFVSGITRPVFVTAPPGDTKRIFVVGQRPGVIRIVDLATRKITGTFMSVGGLTTGNEQGLLGMAFDPNYAENGYFYLNFTASGGGPAGHTEIARYTADGDDPLSATTASAASKKLILSFPQPYSNHNGGWIGFGPDGYLYISSGDGGDGNDPLNAGQSRDTLLGKILRIDVHGGDPYAIPDGNPYKGHESFREEIWAFGLRNPWRASFDRLTGDLWIGDVGQSAREEIDVAPAGVGGLNFGWRPREGTIQTPGMGGQTTVTPYTNPVFDYNRDFGYSVTGGYVYRGRNVPEAYGKYIFADYGSARFWMSTYEGNNSAETVEITSQVNPAGAISGPSSFGEDASGELYICSLSHGRIYRLETTTPPPSLTGVRIDEETGDAFVFTFNAAAGQEYVVEAVEAFPPGDWDEVQTIEAPEEDSSISVTNSLSGEARFFRVRAVAPQP